MALLGVLISVTAFVVVQSVMAGFDQDLKTKIMGFSYHLTLTLSPQGPPASEIMKQLKRNSQVVEAHRFLEGEAVLQTEDGENQGVRVRGIVVPPSSKVPGLQVYFEEGENWSTFSGAGEEFPGILLGTELAGGLGVLPALSEKVELLYPFGEVGPTGEVEPNLRTFRVLGTFKSGYYDYDSKYALVPLEDARFLFGEDQPEKIGIVLANPNAAGEVSKKFSALPGVANVETWQGQHRRLFSALRLERIGMILVLALMLILASFNILSLLMMVVFERRKDIAVLRALGLPLEKIAGVFYRAGLWIGTVGGLLGIALGSGLCYWLASAKPKLPTSYYLDALPVDLNIWVLAGAVLLAPAVSILATILPAREGRKMNVIEALRYE